MRRREVLGLAALAAGPTLAASPPTPADEVAPATPLPSGGWVHAFAAFGEAKYPRGYTHFDYVNPEAPKGGTLFLKNPDRRTAFDKLNYYTIRGDAPAGVALFVMETLTFLGADELQTMYGLLAEEFQVAADRRSVTFRLHPKARFSNGDPVTAEDVKYSHDILAGPYADPSYNNNLGNVARASVLDPRTIRFELKEAGIDQIFKLGRMPVFSRKYGLKADGTRPPFDQIIDETPIGSGPYTVAKTSNGRSIEFQRDPNYWARDLPVTRGMFNFDRIVYRYYADEDVETEAFKAGEYDLMRVYAAKLWTRQLVGPKFRDRRIIKQAIPTETGQGLQSYQLNLRRPILSDIRVRKALCLTYDWDTNDRYPDFGLTLANSVFNNSEFAAQGLPSAGELRLLEPFRHELPAEVFGKPYVAARTGGDPYALRRNLLEARELLNAAGWKLDGAGQLRNAKGDPLVVEFLAPGSQDTDRRMLPWARNAAKVGMTIRTRRVDYALFSRRLQEFDFDMATIVEPDFQLPAVADYADIYGSKSADVKASGNLSGIKSKAVDRALDAMRAATTLEDFRDACRALDRIVMWSYWQVPEIYKADETLAYWNKFAMPAVQPKHFVTDMVPELDTRLTWPLKAWWIKG